MKPRPSVLKGNTYQIPTPVGTAFIIINSNGDGKTFEVFVNVGKRGSDLTAIAEGLGRTISMVLRMESDISTEDRIIELIDQLGGIGGRSLTYNGNDGIYSLPDAVAYALSKELEGADGQDRRIADVLHDEQDGWAHEIIAGGR